MDNRILFLDSGTKKLIGDNDQTTEKPIISILQKSDCCPDCQIRLVRLGNCFSCPLCGYGGCG